MRSQSITASDAAEAAPRFWLKVARTDGCWVWSGAKNGAGYGMIGLKRPERSVLAHRLAWVLENGEIPAGMFVCHRCDNAACVRAAHLFLGTNADNMRDRDIKNRVAHGERHWRAKLSESDVKMIRMARQNGAKLRDLALRYGVSQSRICGLAHGVGWSRLK